MLAVIKLFFLNSTDSEAKRISDEILDRRARFHSHLF